MPHLPTHDLYAEQLFPLDLGYALYEPDPGESENEVRIGDIGYIMNGGFERVASLFNPGNGVNVVVEERFRRIRAYGDIPGHILSSKNIQSVGVRAGLTTSTNEQLNMCFDYTHKSTSGASLVKKYRAIDEKSVYPNILRERFEECAESVFDFAKQSNLPVADLHDIILVTGRIMTGDWATAAFKNCTQSMNMAFHIQTPVAGADLSFWGNWSAEVTFPTKVGPRRIGYTIADGAEPAFDQCIFIKTYRMHSRPWYERLKETFRIANKKGKEKDVGHIHRRTEITGDHPNIGYQPAQSLGKGNGNEGDDSDGEVLTAYEVLAFLAFDVSTSLFYSIGIDDEDVQRWRPSSRPLSSVFDITLKLSESSVKPIDDRREPGKWEESQVYKHDSSTPFSKIGRLIHYDDSWKDYEMTREQFGTEFPSSSLSIRAAERPTCRDAQDYIPSTPPPTYSLRSESDESAFEGHERSMEGKSSFEASIKIPSSPDFAKFSATSNPAPLWTAHPLLEADTFMHSGAPLCWDVRLPPSSATVRPSPDKHDPKHSLHQNQAVDEAELGLPATYPPTVRMEVAIPQLPWKPTTITSKLKCVSVLDLLFDVHASLQTAIRKEEYDSFPKEMRDKIARAFYLRCERVGQSRVEEIHGRNFDRLSREDVEDAEVVAKAEEKRGVKRVDCLLGSTEFYGVALAPDVQNDGAGRPSWILTLGVPRS